MINMMEITSSIHIYRLIQNLCLIAQMCPFKRKQEYMKIRNKVIEMLKHNTLIQLFFNSNKYLNTLYNFYGMTQKYFISSKNI